jgi:hypothetical protein
LARWIASSENPLTARVAVNHIWLRHFGRPLVETVFNFGRSGKPPVDPQLLDWLAVELMENRWRMKPLHRLIVTSAAYRQASTATNNADQNRARDPDNRYLWRFPTARVQAETVRDSMLHAAGELDRVLGGPEIDQALGLTNRRRSLYFSSHGEGRMELLDLFDAPQPAECYSRTISIVPQQALALMNSELSLSLARSLGRRLWAETTTASPEDREDAVVRAAFEQILGRGPTSRELALSREFLAQQRALYESIPAERLAAAADGVAAPSPDPSMRACESLVHALFNHNDFITAR